MLIVNVKLEFEKNEILTAKSLIYRRMLLEAHFQLPSSSDQVMPLERLKRT